MEFPNKAFELINDSATFNNINVTSKLNETCNDFPIHTVTYSLTNATCNIKFNFSTFVSSINVDANLENPETLP